MPSGPRARKAPLARAGLILIRAIDQQQPISVGSRGLAMVLDVGFAAEGAMDVVAKIRSRTQAMLAGMQDEGLLPGDLDPASVSVRASGGLGRVDLVVDAGHCQGERGFAARRSVASRLVDVLAALPDVGAVDVVAPGLVGVTLSLDGLTASLAACLAEGDGFGRGAPAVPVATGLAPRRRPDPAGASLGRARAAAVADALSRILAFAGHVELTLPDDGGPVASAELGRIGIRPQFGAGLSDTWPDGHAAILVHEAEQGVAHLSWSAASTERVAVAPCRWSGRGATGGRGDASLRDALTLADGAAVRFALLARAPGRALELDPHGAADASHANAFFAVQHAHARARGVLRRAAAAMPDLDLAPAALARVPMALLSHPGERALLRSVALYPDRIASAAASRDPSRLVVFLAELARAIHGQWKASKDQPQLRFVNEEQRGLTKARLGLVTAAALVLHSGLGVLGAPAPEEMR